MRKACEKQMVNTVLKQLELELELDLESGSSSVPSYLVKELVLVNHSVHGREARAR